MRRIQPALPLSVIAIVFACSGGAYAAGKITGAQIKDGTITSRDIANRTIALTDIKRSAVGDLQGIDGLPGPSGPQGPPGPAILNQLARVSVQAIVNAGAIVSTTVTCAGGMDVITGGYSATAGEVFGDDSYGGRTTWTILTDNASSVPGTTTAVAYCAPAGSAVQASVDRRPATAIARAIAARKASRP